MQKEPKELSLRDVINIFEYWKLYVYSKRKIIIIHTVIGALLGLTYASVSSKKYSAVLTFALEEKGGNIGSYASIASQFGLDLGGQGGGAFTGDNLIELLQSRLMIEKTLLTTTVINDTQTLLINRYLDYSKQWEEWDDNENLKNIQFDANREKYTQTQDSILNIIQTGILRNNLSINRLDKKLNIVKVIFKGKDELFAKAFTEALVANASSFYIETKTKKSRINVKLLENKIDSVKRELDSRLYGAAMVQDENLNVVRAQLKVPLAQKQIDIQLLTGVYAELSKNLELSRFALMREEPLIQVIDKPILPLKMEKKSRLLFTILIGMLFTFGSTLYLVTKQIIKDA